MSVHMRSRCCSRSCLRTSDRAPLIMSTPAASRTLGPPPGPTGASGRGGVEIGDAGMEDGIDAGMDDEGDETGARGGVETGRDIGGAETDGCETGARGGVEIGARGGVEIG